MYYGPSSPALKVLGAATLNSYTLAKLNRRDSDFVGQPTGIFKNCL